MAQKDYVIFTLVGSYRKSSLNDKKILNSVTTLINNKNQTNVCHQLLMPKEIHKPQNSHETTSFDTKKSPLIVVAIDFGTAYTGYAFVFKHDQEQIHYMKKDFGLNDHCKTPTTLLLNVKKEFHSFGHEAQNFFHNLNGKEASKYYYFDNFKMNLYRDNVNDKLKLKPLNQNTEMNALKVFTISLEHLCSQAMKEISDQCAFPLTKEDISWVITVPAIWSEASKQFMRIAAQKTRQICCESLRIALEPEVASLYCRKYLTDECKVNRKMKDVLVKNESTLFKSGTNYLIVDFGAGTVDRIYDSITAHQIQEDGFIKEVYKSTGGPFGSNEINKQFEDMICSIFGKKLWTKFKKELPSTYLDFIQTFELRKREAKPNRNTAYNILLTYSFMKYFTTSQIEDLFDKNAPNGLSFLAKLGIIRIDSVLMRKYFQTIIEPTIQIIRTLLKELSKSNEIRYIFLVGGFAQSPIFKREIKLTFEPEINVIIPNRAHLSVLYGACQYGLNPTLIKSRRVMRTYGIAILVKFDSNIHPFNKKIIDPLDASEWCCDVFDKFVITNQSIGMFESIKRKYKPVFTNQSSCIFQIYSTTNPDVQFVTDPDVNKCGTLYLDLDPIQYPKNVNPAVKQLIQREMEVEMFFGETEIKISARDLHTGLLVKSNIDFLSKMDQ